jgi:hypothetical protein
MMHVRLLDLDGSILAQDSVMSRYRPVEHDVRRWGRRLRMACRFGRFARFERALADRVDSDMDAEPSVTLYGSGDFHHVSLALVRRQPRPFNLLVLDKHPDWMRAVPFLHCGTWLYHAARLPMVQRVFHVGGDLDFDNAFRWLAPWRLLRSGKITVYPALRRFERGAWQGVVHEPVRHQPELCTSMERLKQLLEPVRADLARWPLYISVDKDVLVQSDAVVNWDSGHLTLAEADVIVRAFVEAARGNVSGMDLCGDWSPVRLRGVLRRMLHLGEHPRLTVDAAEAAFTNSRINLRMMGSLLAMTPVPPMVPRERVGRQFV